MHWWYSLFILFILLVTVRIYVVPNNLFMDGKTIRGLVTISLLIALTSCSTGGLLAKVFP